MHRPIPGAYPRHNPCSWMRRESPETYRVGNACRRTRCHPRSDLRCIRHTMLGQDFPGTSRVGKHHKCCAQRPSSGISPEGPACRASVPLFPRTAQWDRLCTKLPPWNSEIGPRGISHTLAPLNHDSTWSRYGACGDCRATYQRQNARCCTGDNRIDLCRAGTARQRRFCSCSDLVHLGKCLLYTPRT